MTGMTIGGLWRVFSEPTPVHAPASASAADPPATPLDICAESEPSLGLDVMGQFAIRLCRDSTNVSIAPAEAAPVRGYTPGNDATRLAIFARADALVRRISMGQPVRQ